MTDVRLPAEGVTWAMLLNAQTAAWNEGVKAATDFLDGPDWATFPPNPFIQDVTDAHTD